MFAVVAKQSIFPVADHRIFDTPANRQDEMVTVGQDTVSGGDTKHYGIRMTNRLTDIFGNALTVSGTPTVNGVNCTVTYLSTSNGIVGIRVVPTVVPAVGMNARAEAQCAITLSNGEVLNLKIDLTVV